MYVPREFFAVPEWVPVHARGVPRHSRNSSQCQGGSRWMQSKLTWCCRCRNACQKRDILAGGINNMYQRGNINTLRKGWKWIQRVTAYARGVTWHMVELKEPRNKHVAGRMLSCFIHTVGMRSQLPVPGRGEPVLMFQEPRATEILPYTWVLLLQRELALKIPLVSGTIAMYQRRTGPSSEGVNCPKNQLWGIPGDSGCYDAQRCEAPGICIPEQPPTNYYLFPTLPLHLAHWGGAPWLLLSTFRNQWGQKCERETRCL